MLGKERYWIIYIRIGKLRIGLLKGHDGNLPGRGSEGRKGRSIGISDGMGIRVFFAAYGAKRGEGSGTRLS